jgi:uncharacterized protein YciI
MRRILLAIAFSTAITILALHAFARTSRAQSVQQFEKANKQTISCYVMLIRLRHDLYLTWKETGKWPDDKEANAALSGHGKYWQDRLKEGTALMAGGMKGDYWDNAALIIFEAPSEQEANEIAKDDPAVKAKVFQAQVRPFDVHFISNKYHAELSK